jgi:hypothetical protein
LVPMRLKRPLAPAATAASPMRMFQIPANTV